ncbi:MAG: GNAT family N-acetyltransferase [Bacteroidales bacterium]|nr:GNAT family N-acetyltransferase [Bacteroidales bacterium]
MELSKYGVTLKRLTEDKIELVRQWRNNPKIQQYMEYREYITEEMQKNWFQKINNDNNYYFIIVYNNKEIGLINIKNIDYEKGTGEPGIFIWDDEYINSDVTIRASCCQGDFIWNTLKLNELHIHVLKSNKRAIQYNKFFGYELTKNQENKENQEYILTRENMLKNYKKTERLIKTIIKN